MNKIINFFEKPATQKATKNIFVAILVLLFIADVFIEKHEYFSWAGITGFYTVYGFIACAAIVAVSKILGKVWLQKEEDYYD